MSILKSLLCIGAVLCATDVVAQNTFPSTGNVGIGTTSPSYTLDVNGKTRVESNGFNGVTFEQQAYPNQGALLFSSDRTGYTFILGNKRSSDGNVLPIISMYDSGNVGVGTTSPQAKLEVNGNLRFTADGSVQTTAWTGVLCGGDYAESVDVDGDRSKYGPGDVMVIDLKHPGKFLKSGAPYSTAVLGIYSTKPGAVGRRQSTPRNPDEVPMAMIGIVPTKVTAENGPIEPGDLLVTSSTPGFAMRGTDRSRMLGAVIGKAVGQLDSGTGVIEVGVTLQ